MENSVVGVVRCTPAVRTRSSSFVTSGGSTDSSRLYREREREGERVKNGETTESTESDRVFKMHECLPVSPARHEAIFSRGGEDLRETPASSCTALLRFSLVDGRTLKTRTRENSSIGLVSRTLLYYNVNAYTIGV